VVRPVSLRVGQVTLLVSCRTCLTNSAGLAFAISIVRLNYRLFQSCPFPGPLVLV